VYSKAAQQGRRRRQQLQIESAEETLLAESLCCWDKLPIFK